MARLLGFAALVEDVDTKAVALVVDDPLESNSQSVAGLSVNLANIDAFLNTNAVGQQEPRRSCSLGVTGNVVADEDRHPLDTEGLDSSLVFVYRDYEQPWIRIHTIRIG